MEVNSEGYLINVFIDDESWLAEVPEAEEFCSDICEKTIMASYVGELFPNFEISISLAGDEMIQDLNKRFRRKNKPTNVLSFPNAGINSKNYANFPREENILLGDIVVSYGVSSKEAAEQNKKLKDHLAHLVVHGTLHVIGYDHLEEDEAEEMEKIEKEILAKLGISDPYVIND